jgi:MEMO1 family protein
MTPIRPAAVAGTFYPGDRQALSARVEELLAGAGPCAPQLAFPKVLIVPHAGYVYSGAVAARAYDELAAARGIVTRVVLLGPVHRLPVRGLAVPTCEAFATPLGPVALERVSLAEARQLPQVLASDAAHALEHSLEVQLPFLQKTLERFSLVPFAVGMAGVDDVAAVIERLWGGPETVIVISSDLSHYQSYAEARRLDASTIERISCCATDLDHEEACGATPLNGLLAVAKRRGLKIRLLAACNSGDTAGGKARVVGYSSFALYEPGAPAAEDAGDALISIARGSIANGLGLEPAPFVDGFPWLAQHAASFVTLTARGALRGCIGSLEAARALGVDVAANALGAAFQDPRFTPLTGVEWPQCAVEVSVLSRPRPMRFTDEDDLLAQLRAGEDGLILEAEGHRGTFLPQVWESLPDKRSFLHELRRKAGLAADYRLAGCRISRYQVSKWTQTFQ